MGGRAGSGARGGGGLPGANIKASDVVGFKTAPFKGAARAGSLKVGDKIKGQDGTVASVIKIDKLAKGRILLTTKIGDQSFGNITTPSRYVNGTKV